MNKTYLWEATDFPHFYYNPVVVEPLEVEFQKAVKRLNRILGRQNSGFEDEVLDGHSYLKK